jgi:RNA-binding protein
MALSEQQKKSLRGLGHKLKPVVTVGAGGISEPLLAEFERSLEHHELMKIRVKVGGRDERDTVIRTLCRHSRAELLQRIGNVALLFRKKARHSKFTAF